MSEELFEAVVNLLEDANFKMSARVLRKELRAAKDIALGKDKERQMMSNYPLKLDMISKHVSEKRKNVEASVPGPNSMLKKSSSNAKNKYKADGKKPRKTYPKMVSSDLN
jgi:hypothetical protein